MITQYKNIIDKIKKIAGWRENDIINNLKDITIIQDDNNYKVYRFEHLNGNTFDYEAKSNTITG